MKVVYFLVRPNPKRQVTCHRLSLSTSPYHRSPKGHRPPPIVLLHNMFAARRSATSTRQLLHTQRRWGSHAAHEPVNEGVGVSSPTDRDQTRTWRAREQSLNCHRHKS